MFYNLGGSKGDRHVLQSGRQQKGQTCFTIWEVAKETDMFTIWEVAKETDMFTIWEVAKGTNMFYNLGGSKGDKHVLQSGRQ